MGYLFGEILLYLVGAGLIGFVFGWVVRDGVLDKYFDKLIAFFGKPTSSKTKKEDVQEEEPKAEEIVEKETTVEVEEKAVEEEAVVEEAVVEVEKEIEVTTPDEPNKPLLLTEAPEEGADKLSELKGLGPVMEKKLNELGVYTFEQMASWNTEEELWIGTQLSSPKKVISAAWVKQAKELC